MESLEILGQPAVCCSPLAATTMSQEDAALTAHVLKALADPQRVRIVNLLANSEGPVCVCDITDGIGLSQPTTSFHLKKLAAVGLLSRERHGTWAYYSINHAVLRRLKNIFDMKETVR